MIYFVKCAATQLVKIGYSATPDKRFAQLCVGSASPLVLLGVIEGGQDKEREIHQRFAEHRVRGEWFALNAALQSVIDTARPFQKPVAFAAHDPSLLAGMRLSLAEYIQARRGGLTLTAMAAALDTSIGRLSQVKSGDKCSAKLALRIEAFTGGAVDAANLSNDVAMTRAAA